MTDAVIQPDLVSTQSNPDPARAADPNQVPDVAPDAAPNVESTERQADHQAPGTHPDTPSNQRPSGTPDPNVPDEDRKRQPAPVTENGQGAASPGVAQPEQRRGPNVQAGPEAAETNPMVPNDQPSADVQQLNQADTEVPPHTHGQPE